MEVLSINIIIMFMQLISVLIALYQMDLDINNNYIFCSRFHCLEFHWRFIFKVIKPIYNMLNSVFFLIYTCN